MPIDLRKVAEAIVAQSSFTAVIGADYLEVHDTEGQALDNIVFTGDTATWGNFDQYSLTESDPLVIAASILHTLKDAV